MKDLAMFINAEIINSSETTARLFRASYRRADGTARFATFEIDKQIPISLFCDAMRSAIDKIEKDANFYEKRIHSHER